MRGSLALLITKPYVNKIPEIKHIIFENLFLKLL